MAQTVWPASRALSVIPVLFALSFLTLAGFVWFELTKERAGRDPLFEFAHLRFKTYRYGLLTGLVLVVDRRTVNVAPVAPLLPSGTLTSPMANVSASSSVMVP